MGARLIAAIAVWAWLGAGAASAAAPRYAGSEAARAAEREGWRLVRELDVDLGGDGRREICVVERGPKGLVMRVLRWEGDDDEGRFVTVRSGTPRRARRLARLEARPMVGSRHPEVIAVFEDPSPDETALSVRVMGHTEAGIRELFAESFLIGGAPAGIREDARPRVVFADVRGDEAEEIVFVSGPQILELPGRDGPVPYVIGAYRDVYAFAPGPLRFEKVAAREVVDFMADKTVSEAKASAQVPKIWGTAQPFWGADGDLETSWNVPAREARGQTLTVKVKGAPEVRLIRVVPGCGGSALDWERYGRLTRFRLDLASGRRIEIDRGDLSEIPRGVEAMGEFPLAGGFGAQLLIALAEPAPLSWARIEILEADRRGVDEVCLSEISFH